MKIELNPNLSILLKLEQLVIFAGSLVLFFMVSELAWWVYLLLFFLPDIAIAAYLINNKTGAFFYNLFHHQGIMILLAFSGYYWNIPWLFAAGIIFTGHSSFDRIFGYGLKFEDDFKHTHLGRLGNS